MMSCPAGRSRWLVIACGCLLSLLSSDIRIYAAEPAAAAAVKSPLSPEESLKQFRLHPDLKIELVAAEPEVIDPVSIAFDENGALWAVEMTDYPNGPQPGQPPMSRIRTLQDKDGDGRYETSRVFADKLLFATGLQPWKGGVIITLAGQVAWFKDSDGDGTADIRQTWFTGFTEGNPQLRANHPHWDLDNRIYIANGLRGGTVIPDPQAWKLEQKPLTLSSFDFRFHPLTGEAEAVSGVGQFGMTFDDAGNRFVCSNRNPCRQIILEDQYLKRNPLLAVKDVGADAVPSGPDSHVYPLSQAWTTSTTHAGQFTAACGVLIYRGTGLPEEFYGNAFTCEPTGNLVHREVLKRAGVQFSAVPTESKTEFLATPDTWFRPVDLVNGPDGALYVVDMYRAVIEHPEWVPDELKHRPDERDGSDKGRIYRIVSANAKARPPVAPFTPEITTQQLVEKLASRDCWQAETAGRILLDREATGTAAALVEEALSGKSELGRLRAYRLVESFGIGFGQAVPAIDDPSPLVRAFGVTLIGRLFSRNPKALPILLRKMRDDADPRVRFQLALCLGDFPEDAKASYQLAKILLQDADDEWTRRAVLTSAGRRPEEFLDMYLSLLTPLASRSTGQMMAFQEIANLIGAQQELKSFSQALKTTLQLPDARLQVAGFLGLCQGVQRRGQSVQNAISEAAKQDEKLSESLVSFSKKAAESAVVAEQAMPERLDWLSVLQFQPWETAKAPLLQLLGSDVEQEIRLKVIDVLATFNDESLTTTLLSQYGSQTPAVRRAIIRALLRNPQRVAALLQAMSDKQISTGELDPTQVNALVNHADQNLRKQAQQVLQAAIPQERKQVLEQFQRALKIEAKPERGRLVFEKNCATCHQIGKIGVVVGPDIADSRTKTPAQLLTDILNPNQAIDNNYVSYTVVTKDGRAETGFIANETAASITLKQPENKTLLILRQDIEELKSNGISLMPEGLEKNISVEQMADLISFVKNWRYLDGQVPIKISAP